MARRKRPTRPQLSREARIRNLVEWIDALSSELAWLMGHEDDIMPKAARRGSSASLYLDAAGALRSAGLSVGATRDLNASSTASPDP